MEKPTQPFRLHQYEFPMICIQEDRHLYDALKIMSEQNLSALPVINHEMSYLGSISLKSLLQGMAELQSVHEPGAVLILEMNVLDYSLSQIAQIVEGNDAKILSATLTSSPDSTKVEVTLKINKQDLNQPVNTTNSVLWFVANGRSLRTSASLGY